jgi:hypothetical protein
MVYDRLAIPALTAANPAIWLANTNAKPRRRLGIVHARRVRATATTLVMAATVGPRSRFVFAGGPCFKTIVPASFAREDSTTAC